MKNYFSKSRVETFSDGVFAIIVTLLVLELKVPSVSDHQSVQELVNALMALLPKFISWIISFFTVCVIWVNHHRLFKMFRIFSHGLFWWNAVLLLWVSFIPFPTALMGDYSGNRIAVILYGLVMTLMAATFSFMRAYVINNNEILEPGINKDDFKKGTILSVIFGPGLYLAGTIASFVHPYLSFLVFIFIPVYFIFPHATQEVEISEEHL
jgi:uncharacterized membrane protein